MGALKELAAARGSGPFTPGVLVPDRLNLLHRHREGRRSAQVGRHVRGSWPCPWLHRSGRQGQEEVTEQVRGRASSGILVPGPPFQRLSLLHSPISSWPPGKSHSLSVPASHGSWCKGHVTSAVMGASPRRGKGHEGRRVSEPLCTVAQGYVGFESPLVCPWGNKCALMIPSDSGLLEDRATPCSGWPSRWCVS